MKCPHCLITLDITQYNSLKNHLDEYHSNQQEAQYTAAQGLTNLFFGQFEAAKQLAAANPFYSPNGDIKSTDTLADKIKQLQAQLTAAKQKVIELETTLKVLENK